MISLNHTKYSVYVNRDQYDYSQCSLQLNLNSECCSVVASTNTTHDYSHRYQTNYKYISLLITFWTKKITYEMRYRCLYLWYLHSVDPPPPTPPHPHPPPTPTPTPPPTHTYTHTHPTHTRSTPRVIDPPWNMLYWRSRCNYHQM